MSRKYQIHGITVYLREVAGEPAVYTVIAQGQSVGQVLFVRMQGRPSWRCSCGGHEALRPTGVLAHVIGSHSSLGKRPRLDALDVGVPDEDRPYEAVTTYLRLAGAHADPTYEQAVVYPYSR